MLNSECLEVFNKYLVEVKKCSTNTLSSYMRDVRQFGDYMQTHTTEDIVSATKDELSEYIDWLKGNGKSVATVSRAIASLKCMYGVLCEDGYVSENPTVKLAPEKSQHKLPQILTSKEVDLLLEQPSCTDAKGYRDRAMLELLYATGIRVSELIALNISDVNTSAGVVRCAPNTEKERLIPLYSTAVKALNEYIEFVRPQMIALPTEQALFVNVSGERMSRQGFWKIIKSYQQKAHIEKTAQISIPFRKCSGTRTYPRLRYIPSLLKSSSRMFITRLIPERITADIFAICAKNLGNFSLPRFFIFTVLNAGQTLYFKPFSIA